MTSVLSFTKESSNHSETLFAPVCSQIAEKLDEAIDSRNLEKVKRLISEARSILLNHDESSFGSLFYAVGTALAYERDELIKKKALEGRETGGKSNGNPFTCSDVVKIHGDVLWFLRHSEELICQIEEREDTKPYLDETRLVLYVNLGNALDFCGRKCSAMEYYSKALAIRPFIMAYANIGKCIDHYAFLEGDSGHKIVLLKKAYSYYLKTEQSDPENDYQSVKDRIKERMLFLEKAYGKELLCSPFDYKEVKTKTGEEMQYRSWCLENHLFLNPLNDLLELNWAFSCDPLHLSFIRADKNQTNPPFVFEMVNQIKEEYIYSRFMLYESTKHNNGVHYADKDSTIFDILNYSSYSIRHEKLKTAYRTLFSIFDRISFLLNMYFELGLKEHDVSFDHIWEKLNQKEEENIAIQALHWINRDFRERFGDADTPHARMIRKLRNALEHKFVAIHVFPVENEMALGADSIYRISEDHMFDYAMELLKLVREAIIELTIAIRIEENSQIDDSKQIVKISMFEYSDDYKR